MWKILRDSKILMISVETIFQISDEISSNFFIVKFMKNFERLKLMIKILRSDEKSTNMPKKNTRKNFQFSHRCP